MNRLLALLAPVALAASLSGCGGASAAPEPDTASPPKRIVSMNPCVDTVLLDIADPGQIAAVSHYSHDPRASSAPLAQALRYPAVSDAAEDVLALSPDLVIAGRHVAPQTIAALQRMGIPLMQLGVPDTVAQSEQQISDIAERIGRVEQGAALNRRIAAALAAAAPPAGSKPISALIWQSSGLVPGPGTLADELLTRTGFRNLSADMGMQQWDRLPLEGLLLHPPRVLMAGAASMGAGDGEANRMISHPALQLARKHIHIADYPAPLLHCGGPVIMRSVARMAAIRREVERTRP